MRYWAKGLFGTVLIIFALYGVREVIVPVVCPPPKPKPVTVIQKVLIGNEYEREVVRLTNAFRNKHGLSSLKINGHMMVFARNWSAKMANGRMVHSRGPYGENICKGYATPQAAVQAWERSPGHRRNMLNSRYTEIGVGQVGSSYTQVFR